jgi:3-deoxy-D-manno-octulosonate 8-phosphate phosphatase KdsC-like HAD superfamily phosphatase
MIRRHRVLALAAVLAITLTACGRNDAKRSDVVNAMQDAGLNKTQSNCIGDGLQAAFGDDQKLFNQVASASSPKDLPKGTEKQVQDVLDKCVGADAGSTTTTREGGGSTTTTTGG